MTVAAIAFSPQGDRCEAYYRAMTVAFASLRRFNPALRTVLVTDSVPPERVPGAELLVVPFRHPAARRVRQRALHRLPLHAGRDGGPRG